LKFNLSCANRTLNIVLMDIIRSLKSRILENYIRPLNCL